MLDVEIAWTQKIGYGKIMSTTLPWTHIKIYKRTKSGLQMFLERLDSLKRTDNIKVR